MHTCTTSSYFLLEQLKANKYITYNISQILACLLLAVMNSWLAVEKICEFEAVGAKKHGVELFLIVS